MNQLERERERERERVESTRRVNQLERGDGGRGVGLFRGGRWGWLIREDLCAPSVCGPFITDQALARDSLFSGALMNDDFIPPLVSCLGRLEGGFEWTPKV